MSGKSTDPFAEFNEPSTDDHGQLFDHPLSAARKPTASSGLMEAHTTISSSVPAGSKAATVDSVSKAAPNPITFEPVPSPSGSDDDNFQENEFWVKLLIQGNTHRVKLSQKSFAELSQAASNAVLSASQAEAAKSSEQAAAPTLAFKYVDEEGEMVSINSDGDLRDAFTIANKYRMVLKVTVINTTVSQGAEKKEVEVPTLMKAAFYRQYGPIDKTLQFMQEWPVPKITQPNQVLIRIHASAINPIDVRMLAGDMSFMHMIKPFPIVPGFDVSGVVVKAGLYCRRLKPGDQVYGLASFRRLGTFAEYVVMEEDEASLKPANLSHAEAASLPMVAITGYRALVLSARLDKGQKILILGGSGGCGSFGIQLAKWVGAHVVVTCSKKNMELCRQLGADEVIDYTDPGSHWWDVLKGQDFDVIYDTVGGADSWQQSTQVLKKKEGKYVTIAGDTASGEESKWTVKSIFQRGAAIASRKIMSLFGGNKYEFVVGATASYPILDSVRELCVNGFVKPVIDTLYQLEDAQLIFDHCDKGHTRGKSVISVVSEREDDRYPRYFHDNSADKAAPSDKLPAWMPEPGQAAASAAAQRPVGERFRPSGRDLNEHGGGGYGDDDL